MEHKINGCLPSPSDLRDFRVSSSVTNVELPSEFRLENYDIKDQGNVNSCVAHALSSMLEKSGWKFSTGWIYGYRPDGYYQGEGMYPREALNTLLKKGAVKKDDFDYNIEMIKAKDLVDKNIDKLEVLANDYHITSYARLFNEKEIKSWMFVHNIAVPIAVETEDLKVDKDNIIKIPSEYPNAGHALLIVGWNELGFIIQNSWGKNWGDNGYAILPYEYRIREAWGVTTTERHSEESVTTPCMNFARTIIQKIIIFFRKTFERKE